MTTVHWLKPAPLWNVANVAPDLPWLARFDGDDFLDDFLALMAGPRPDELGSAEHIPVPPPDGGPLKLYQPLHGAYYLVCGELVCGQVGLPDRRVRTQDGERAAFVVRRLRNGEEQAWVDQGPQRGWQPLLDPRRGTAVLIRADEERFPLHSAPAPQITAPSAAQAAGNPLALAVGCCRTVQFGYLAAGNRAKYEAPVKIAPANAATYAQQYADDLAATRPEEGDLRLGEIDDRAIGAWKALLAARAGTPDTATLHSTSLYLLVDLGEVLQRHLGPVFDAVTGGADLPAADAGSAARRALRDALLAIRITRTSGGTTDNTAHLSDALAERKDDLGLAFGQGAEPTDPQYDLKAAKQPNGSPLDAGYLDTLHGLFASALAEQKTDDQAAGRPWLRLTPDAAQMLADQVAPQPAVPSGGGAAGPQMYQVRLVYERPGCRPILSSPSLPFALASPVDPDAPARHIRIELPSIKPKDLRKYARGVGLAMSPELRDLMNRITPDMLKGDGLAGSPGGWSLGMICSFNLSIVFLIAFIIMFVFLLLLNFVFWWVAFLKICFPIPRRSS